MTGDEFARLLQQQSDEIRDFMDNRFPYYAGDIAVEHFRENFDKQGFVNNGLHPWLEVHRREPTSPWYGRDIRNGGVFSEKRTTDPILHETSELYSAMEYEVRNPGEVTIVNDKPYAAIQNEGGIGNIFGRGSVLIPQRQYVGHSKELDDKVEDMLTDELDNIIPT